MVFRRSYDPPATPTNPLPITIVDPTGVARAQSVELSSPQTSDGKPIFLPCLFPGNVFLFVCGASETDTDRGAGGLFTVSSEGAGDTVKNLDPFLDYLYLAGGTLVFTGGQLGDWLSCSMICPATEVTPNAESLGNCNLMPCPPCPGLPSGTNLIIPAIGNGGYDVDLAKATPIPSHDTEEPGIGAGFYNWIQPSHGMGRGELVPDLTMRGDYHLVDREVHLVNFVNKVPLLGQGQLDVSVQSVKPKKILPHWHGRMTLHNTGHTGLQAALMIVTARRVTV